MHPSIHQLHEHHSLTREYVAASQRLLPCLVLCFLSSIHAWSGSCLSHPVELTFSLHSRLSWMAGNAVLVVKMQYVEPSRTAEL